MPCYYFHAKFDGHLIRDERGDELADDEAALERAVQTARILVRAGAPNAKAWTGCVFEVTDENGEPVWTVPVSRIAAMAAGTTLP
jgi:hypothetical protein